VRRQSLSSPKGMSAIKLPPSLVFRRVSFASVPTYVPDHDNISNCSDLSLAFGLLDYRDALFDSGAGSAFAHAFRSLSELSCVRERIHPHGGLARGRRAPNLIIRRNDAVVRVRNW
jgi:hypothetical protein